MPTAASSVRRVPLPSPVASLLGQPTTVPRSEAARSCRSLAAESGTVQFGLREACVLYQVMGPHLLGVTPHPSPRGLPPHPHREGWPYPLGAR